MHKRADISRAKRKVFRTTMVDLKRVRTHSVTSWKRYATGIFVTALLYVTFLQYPRSHEKCPDAIKPVTSSKEPDVKENATATIKPVTSSTERDFKKIATATNTDKVAGYIHLPNCLNNRKQCTRPDNEREVCRTWGHFYDTIYNRWLKKYSTDDAEKIQFLEIGYYNGRGFEAYSTFLPRAETHSMEISCLEPGPRSEGKWPEEWGNSAKEHRDYESLRKANRLHCGDANDYDFLKETWTKFMKRPGAPPLKVVVDDGSHLSEHMATSLFFWLPRIEPGGILVMEDIQPIKDANMFRTHILPQVIKDLHWCGNDSKELKDTRCFPSIQPLLAGVHCEMHICVFERNNEPSLEPNKKDSMTPNNAFSNAQKCLFGPHE